LDYAVHALICCVICAFGSLVGAGGGFLMMPLFLLFYAGKTLGGVRLDDHAQLHFMSLFAVMVNGLASTWNYGRQGRIDFRTAVILSLCAVPAGVVMKSVMASTRSDLFTVIFGLFLVAMSLFVFWRASSGNAEGDSDPEPRPRRSRRKLIDKSGRAFEWSFDIRLGMGVAAFEGGLAGFFGVGGGFLRVPIMTQMLNFPAHVASATSMFIVTATALTVVAQSIYGDLAANGGVALPYGLAFVGGAGAVVGARLGAELSRRVTATRLLVLVAVALFLGGLLLMLDPFLPAPPAP
jgi:hypothetical protein